MSEPPAGVAPFDELDLMWTDHFIGAHELRIEHLDAETSIGLLTRPSDDFPPDTIPAEVAAEITRRADGQPLLLQLYGQLLVMLLDSHQRRGASLDDLESVEEELLSAGASLFPLHLLRLHAGPPGQPAPPRRRGGCRPLPPGPALAPAPRHRHRRGPDPRPRLLPLDPRRGRVGWAVPLVAHREA